MELKDQVTNLELSKKLKKLGFKQESLFAHLPFGDGYGLFYDWQLSKDEHISAYTVAELGEMLPNPLNLDTKDTINRAFFGSEHVGGSWECGSEKILEHTFEDKLEVNARAKMLIYLKENKLI